VNFKGVKGERKLKPWLEAVLDCIEEMGQERFLTRDIYKFENRMSEMYPDNNNVIEKMRQQLIFLTNSGVLERVEKGSYRLLAKELLDSFDFEPNTFVITETALPNYPPSGLREPKNKGIRGTPNSKSILDRRRDERLGDAGERAILHREKELLKLAGRGDLAERAEQVSKTKGDYIGYDILSFKHSGEEKWIEVKTTKGHQSSKFHISENQIATSADNPERYQLHRLYDFNIETSSSKLYIILGNLRSKLELTPTNYLGRIR